MNKRKRDLLIISLGDTKPWTDALLYERSTGQLYIDVSLVLLVLNETPRDWLQLSDGFMFQGVTWIPIENVAEHVALSTKRIKKPRIRKAQLAVQQVVAARHNQSKPKDSTPGWMDDLDLSNA